MRNLLLIISLLLSCQLFAQDKKVLRDSIETLNALIKQKPDSVDLHLKKAAAYVELGDWNFALDEYTIVLDHHPYNMAALFYRAYVHEHMRHYAMARNDYERLLRIMPKDYNTQLCLALLNQKDNRPSVAYDQINNLIEMFPDSASAYAARAEMMCERKMYEAAIYDLGEALQRDPDNMSYLQARYDLYMITGNEKKARQDRDKMSKLNAMLHQQ